MSDEDVKPFVDKLLDASFERYRSVEPPLGLEQRLLAKLTAAAHPASQAKGPLWVAAAAASLAAVMTSVALLRRPAIPPPSDRTAQSSSRRTTNAGGHPSPAEAPPTIRSRIRSQRRERRLNPPMVIVAVRSEQFPTAVPLSAQEKLLVQLVKKLPIGVKLADSAEKDSVADLKTEALNIPRLDVKPLPSPQEEPE